MINKEQLMAFTKIEKLPNEMRFDLFNANRICHQPEISLVGSFKNCRFLKLRGTVEFRVGKIHLNEKVLKQLGIFQEHLAGCPRSQDPSD